MTTITINGAIYLDTDSPMPWEREEPRYAFFSGEAKAFTHYVPVIAHTITVEAPDDFDPRPQQIKSLHDQREELHAKFAAAVREIDRRLSELQAIEYSPSEAA